MPSKRSRVRSGSSYPVAAGGTSDIAARLIADGIKDAIGQPVIVENRPGATGRIAAEALKSAAPDGATLMLAPIAVTVLAPLVLEPLGYDPVKDFAPVAQVGRYEFALAVRPDHPARTVPELIAWARANPAQATFGTAGAGSVPHLLGVMLSRATGTELVHVPYRGLAQVEGELMGGQIAAAISALSDLSELHRNGRIRIIATSGAKRSSLLPSVPTFGEQGFAAIEAVGWNAVYAPAQNAEAGDRPAVGRNREVAARSRGEGEAHQPRNRADRHDARGARGDHGGRHGPLGAGPQGCGIQRRSAAVARDEPERARPGADRSPRVRRRLPRSAGRGRPRRRGRAALPGSRGCRGPRSPCRGCRTR